MLKMSLNTIIRTLTKQYIRAFSYNISCLLLSITGHPELTTEMHSPWTYAKITAAEVNALFGNLQVTISSVYYSKRLGACYARAFVADDQEYRPTITLLNNAKTWEAGKYSAN